MARSSMEQVWFLGECLISTPRVLTMGDSDLPCIVAGRT